MIELSLDKGYLEMKFMIKVVAGIIYKNDKFLIAQRNLKKDQGGLWEFPRRKS